jgi:hypothetical protein
MANNSMSSGKYNPLRNRMKESAVSGDLPSDLDILNFSESVNYP